MNSREIDNFRNEIPLFLTVKDIHHILGISLNTAYGLIRSGELRAKTVVGNSVFHALSFFDM